jgi:carboxypeptidase C (cathepsin A)
MFNKLISFGAALLVGSVSCAPDGDKFTQLPEFNFTMPTDSYSGYLEVNENKSLHYVFIESENDPSKDPVLIWFNGGPGCSSMLAFTQENGPIVIDDDLKTYTKNPYPWNSNASLLYLESPAGVGFSYAADNASRIHSDVS